MKTLSLAFIFALAVVSEGARIKDLTSIGGSRDNQLFGYGLVVGLAGDGDSSSEVTQNSLGNAMSRFGLSVDSEQLKADNVAAVMITATMPPFAREGTRIDITVSSIGDAESIQGGVLVQAPLMGADGVVYAVAQGEVQVGGFIGGANGPGGAIVQKNHPTVGKVPNGAIVEREIEMDYIKSGSLGLVLMNPDFDTASRMAEAINQIFPQSTIAMDSSSLKVAIPELFEGREVDFISTIGGITIDPDTAAKVVINERTGTIVATAGVRVSTVAVSHGAITVTVARDTTISQPGAFSNGNTEVVDNVNTGVQEQKGSFYVINEYPTINQVTAALNAMGVTTREMMSILQAMKTAGALQAELITN